MRQLPSIGFGSVPMTARVPPMTPTVPSSPNNRMPSLVGAARRGKPFGRSSKATRSSSSAPKQRSDDSIYEWRGVASLQVIRSDAKSAPLNPS